MISIEEMVESDGALENAVEDGADGGVLGGGPELFQVVVAAVVVAGIEEGDGAVEGEIGEVGVVGEFVEGAVDGGGGPGSGDGGEIGDPARVRECRRRRRRRRVGNGRWTEGNGWGH